MVEPKPCPFCGGKAIIRSLKEYYHDELLSEKYSAVCENKRCIARNCNKYFKTAGDAAEAWNKRAERRGRWIDGKCNRCGTHAPYWTMASTYYLSEYCPHCGAKMRGESDES